MGCVRLSAFVLLAALSMAVPFAPAAAQEPYPNRPIHIVVPFPAGGPSDVVARLLGERLSANLGQPVVIDNRPGANTVIGAELVAKAPPDGYTLLMAIDSTLVMNQYLYTHLPYDPLKDFAPVSLAAKNIGWLVVNASSPYRTAGDLIGKAKAAPGKLNCGAGTITTKLTCILFDEKFGLDTVLISFNGSANVAQGVLTGGADFVFDGTSAELPLVQAGQLRALAKLDRRPFAPLPELPSLFEATGVDLGDLSVLERPRRAARHAHSHHRQAFGGDREGGQRSGLAGQSRSRRHLSGELDAARVLGLHRAGGRALAGRRKKKRTAF